MDTYFNDADTAFAWATEILRKRRFPKLSGIYNEMERPVSLSRKVWLGQMGIFPMDADERYSLALKIYKAFHHLPSHMQRLLMLKYWGDYADDARLQGAKQMQMMMRSQGKRVQLQYRYSNRNLGVILGMDHKTVGKRVADALYAFAQELEEADVLRVIDCRKAS